MKRVTLPFFLFFIFCCLPVFSQTFDIPKVVLVNTYAVSGENGIPYQKPNLEDGPHPRVFKIIGAGDVIIGTPRGIYIFSKSGILIYRYKRPYVSHIAGEKNKFIVSGANSSSESAHGILELLDGSYSYRPTNLPENKQPTVYREGVFFVETRGIPDKISDVWWFDNKEILSTPIEQWIKQNSGYYYMSDKILFSKKTGPIASSSSPYESLQGKNNDTKKRIGMAGAYFDIDKDNSYYFLSSDFENRPAIIIRDKNGRLIRFFSLAKQVAIENGIDYPSIDEQGNIYFLVPGAEGHKLFMIKNDWSEELKKNNQL